MDHETRQNTKVYKALGKAYLESIDALAPGEIVEFMSAVRPGGAILDVGCAGGRDSRAFVDRGFTVIGVDLVNTFLDAARERVPEATFFKQDVRALTFDDASFDGIWAQAVLMHLKRDELPRVLATFHRLLKPGGMLHVRVKEGEGEQWVTDKLSPSYKRFFSFFQPSEIERMVKIANLAITRSETLPDPIRPDLSWVWVLAKKS